MPSPGAVRRFFALLSVSAGLSLVAPVAPAAADEPSPYDGPTKPAAQVDTPAADAPRPVAKKRRGGLNPCMTPDPGFGIYEPWNGSGMSMGQILVPHQGGISKSGQFDVMIHFHGHEPVRKEFVKTAKGMVLVGIDLGIGSGAYQTAFSSPSAFTNLLASVEAAVARHAGRPSAKIRKLALSSWSAGYGAIEQILRQPAGKKVDALVLLDSVHAGYTDEQAHSLKTEQLVPFVEFARRAAKKQTFMFLSHSSIIPPGYASTTEVADYLVHQLGNKPKKSNRQDVLGLDMIERFDKGNFHMRGYTGDDKPDHCAHIGLLADVVRSHLEPRWKSPKGKK
jgi:hypothetical protein